MRVSEYYKLNRTQPTLDFVDVDIRGDTRIFVDPRALRLLPSTWGDECVALVQDFFSTVLKAIDESRNEEARQLLGVLREPNETHLGLSRGVARGRALGPHSSRDVWKALTKSEAVQTGLLEDLEDTILMVEGISSDIISDITTNIIREPLIEYTQTMASYYEIPLQPDISSGPVWNPNERQWTTQYVNLPMTDFGKLLLVPKVIVRHRMDYDQDEYYRGYILEHLRNVELDANSELVQLLKNGSRRVTKKDLKKKYGTGKSVIVRETLRHPDLLRRYRDDKNRQYRPPLDHIDISFFEGTPLPDWDALRDSIYALRTGREDATNYENAVERLLTTLFYPSLTNPQVQRKIHEGRKRIDITYTNVATEGFFSWLSQHFAASHIFVECKNYQGDPGNPELDQLSGRFSPSRGQCGLLVCRRFTDKDLFLRRCKDTANDQRGFIIPLDDSDLAHMVEQRKNNQVNIQFELLKNRFGYLIM